MMKRQYDKYKDYQERINRTLVYIQRHVNDEIMLDDLANVAHFSRFHFHRIFTALVGESVSAYVRRLRLQEGALDLVYTDKSINDIALDMGYETASAFSKAFKQTLGMTPSEMREKRQLPQYDNFYFNLQDKSQAHPVDYQIETLPTQKLLFVQRVGSYEESIPVAWACMIDYAKSHNIDLQHCDMLSITHDDPAIIGEEYLRYDACLAGVADPIADGEIGVRTIGGRYAVFQHVGPYDTLATVYYKAYGEWLPRSGETLREEPALCWYVNHPRRPYAEVSNAERQILLTKLYLPLV